MRRLFQYIFLVLLLCGNVAAQPKDRDVRLSQLFDQLKNSSDTSKSLEIEMKIWSIWSTHPTKEKLTQSLARGSSLMSQGKLVPAYKIFSTIIVSAPDWAEGWNKRATVLYLMGRYQDSLNDIDEVLKRESRHFGALSGQGLVQTAMKNYQKAIDSYIEAHKVYPAMETPLIMIEKLKIKIKKESV